MTRVTFIFSCPLLLVMLVSSAHGYDARQIAMGRLHELERHIKHQSRSIHTGNIPVRDHLGRPLIFPGEDGDIGFVDYNNRYISSKDPIPANLDNVVVFEAYPDEDIKFYYYSKNQEDGKQILVDSLNGVTLESGPVKFVVHGFRGNGQQDWVLEIKSSLIEEDETVNVIVIDWAILATEIYYPIPRANTRQVGRYSAQLMMYLRETGHKNKLHCVGHSLGAHVCGYAGKNAKQAGVTLDRITGLDPAGLLFYYNQPDDRLSQGDATFVDIIHTSGRVGGVGFKEPIGHLDFFPNGGGRQPGCDVDILGGCSHTRSCLLYIESISASTKLIGTSCKSYELYIKGVCVQYPRLPMGEHARPTANLLATNFYLQTSDAVPYGRG